MTSSSSSSPPSPGKRIVIICRRPPYGSALARESLEVALATSVFDQQLAVVFTGDGVWQLQGHQNSSDIHAKNQGKLLAAFPIYDINEIYIDEQALHERNINPCELVLSGELHCKQTLAEIIDGFDVILNF
jgi:tRNA 2-thiouridine synthesizing protein C